MDIREAAVAGSFYPATANGIINQIEDLLNEERSEIDLSFSKKHILGGILPHAGYIYSGYEAVHFFDILRNSEQKYDSIFILHPNHRGYGPDLAVDEKEAWQTPLGKVFLDVETMEMMELPRSALSHQHEHSGEVIVPFLQYFIDYEFKIVPVSIKKQIPDTSKELADKIFEVEQRSGLNFLILASSDFSHYVHPVEGEKTDKAIIDKVLLLDDEKFYHEIRRTGASVCGYGPIMTLMNYVKICNKNPEAALLKFGNSGKKYPSDSVVDYASILFYNS